MMKQTILIVAAIAALFVYCLPAVAFQDQDDPILDAKDKRFSLPHDLSKQSLEELIRLRNDYNQEMKRVSAIVEEKADKEKLFQALTQYDIDRVSIVEVIPALIKEYKICCELKTQLESYAETFREIHDEFSAQRTSISDYKRYGFRIVAAYASMLLYIRENDAKLHQRLLDDMDNQKTAIGAYIHRIQIARARVEAVNNEVKEYHLLRQLRSNVDKIQAVINERDWQ